jgi:bifunctional non-homologous end joining protein LigD
VLPSEDGTEVLYVLVNDEATLLYLVNQGTLTFHVGCSRIADLDRPDCVLFDLDPGGGHGGGRQSLAQPLAGRAPFFGGWRRSSMIR